MAHTTLRPPATATAATKVVSRAWSNAAEIEDTLDEVLDEVGRRHHRIDWVRVRAPGGLHGVALARDQLRELLLVLVENAAEASGAAGQVTIKASNTGEGTFHLMVRDRGPGLSPGLGDRLFQPGATTKAAGHGFGLFLARRLVEAQGGRLSAAPAHGGGALFSVILPQPRN
jgi:signal transduction histidine kinase